MHQPTTYSVLIAGAGPVGLFLACELALQKVSCAVLERTTSTHDPWKHGPLGFRGLNTRSVEAFYRRGLLDKVFSDRHSARKSERAQTFQRRKDGKPQFVGHFAGMMLDGNLLDLSRWRYFLPGPSTLPGPTFQGHLERVLAERAVNLGVPILRGKGVVGVRDIGDEVHVTTMREDASVDESGEVLKTKYLVGCDGGRSTVRKAAGFEFTGTDGEFVGYRATCTLDKPELLKMGFNITPKGMYIVPGPGAVYVVDFATKDFDRKQPVTREHFESVLRRVSGLDIRVNALELASSFTDRCYQATQYRKGRVLLAGDSAHIHSPLGAQGLNTGIEDAINLGWKLASTLHGTAPEGLLDTYHAERHPAAAAVLDWSRAQVSTLRPNPSDRATAKIIRDLLQTEQGVTYFVERVWGATLKYDLDSKEDLGSKQDKKNAHALIGLSAPDFEFADETRLGPKLEQGKFLMVDFEDNEELRKYIDSLAGEVLYYAGVAKEMFGLKALLVRPDGTVIWAEEGEVDVQRLKDVLARWIIV